MLERVVGEHIELRTTLRGDAGWIHADLNQMEGVLLNLSTNARDAMAGGGVLTIETERVDVSADRPIPRLDLAPGSYVRLIVKDTGHGMDGVTQQRLFEPFYTTKAEGLGTGLGLSSVYGGVEQNSGRILVWSEPGKGSEFSIYLPRVEPPELAVKELTPVRKLAGEQRRFCSSRTRNRSEECCVRCSVNRGIAFVRRVMAPRPLLNGEVSSIKSISW